MRNKHNTSNNSCLKSLIIDSDYSSMTLRSGREGSVEGDGQHLHRPWHHAGSRGHHQRVHAATTVMAVV